MRTLTLLCLLLSSLAVYTLLVASYSRGIEDETVKEYYEHALELKNAALEYAYSLANRTSAALAEQSLIIEDAIPVAVKSAPLPRRLYDLGYGNSSQWTDGISAFAEPGSIIVYTWSNLHTRDFLLSYVLQLRGFGITDFVIGCLDESTFQWLEHTAMELNMVVPALHLDSGLGESDFGWNSPRFKQMARYKFESVVNLLNVGYSVFVSDVDVSFNMNPILDLVYYEADMMASTDALRRAPSNELFHSTINIGVMLFRPTPDVVAFVRDFYTSMINDPGFGTTLWDQSHFNEQIKRGAKAADDGSDTMLAWNGRIRVKILPPELYCPGQPLYSQNLPQRLQKPFVLVHQIFQFGGSAGKRHRLREFLLWRSDTETYYARKVLNYIYVPAKSLVDEGPKSVKAHFSLVNDQIIALRNAWGIARSLGRALVLPQLIAGIDRAWFSWYVDGGPNMFPGSDPISVGGSFIAPADHILDLEQIEKRNLLDEIREYSFLSNPRLPKSALVSHAHVSFDTAATHTAHVVKHGANDVELRDALRDLNDTAIITMTSMTPGSFGGFVDAKQQEEFTELMRTLGGIWCCPQGASHMWYDYLIGTGDHTDRQGRQVINAAPWEYRGGDH